MTDIAENKQNPTITSQPDETPNDDCRAGNVPASHNLDNEPFPWHIGIYDAHCHPTDSMHAIPSLPTMKTHVLTIMATRSEDQDLVSKVLSEHAYNPFADKEVNQTSRQSGARIIPSFGYHPWFSHLIYDDLATDADTANTSTEPEMKKIHYNNVLTSPPVDNDLLTSLPSPTPLSQILTQTRTNLLAHPHALLGEVGLDRTFRIPHGSQWRSSDDEESTSSRREGLTPGTHHSHPLTKHRVSPGHQVRILQAQLRLAGELGRAASVHVVGGQGAAFDALREMWKGHERHVTTARERKIAYRKKGEKPPDVEVEGSDDDSEGDGSGKPFPPRICLHSFSGAAETVAQYLHPSIPVEFFFSFSEAINFSLPGHQQRGKESEELDPASARALAALKAVPEDRLLVESDLHICGDRMDSLLEAIVRRICVARGWTLDYGAERLKKNWKRFVFGEQIDGT